MDEDKIIDELLEPSDKSKKALEEMGIEPQLDLFSPDDNPFDTVDKLSKGKPGVINLLMLLQRHDIGQWILVLLKLCEENISGDSIWVLFKDLSDSDMDKFIHNVLEMTDEIRNKLKEEQNENEQVGSEEEKEKNESEG